MWRGGYPAMSLKEARDEYLKTSIQVKDLRRGKADGVDPVKEIKQKAEQRLEAEAEYRRNPTVSSLVEDYLTKHAKVKKRSWAKDEAMLNRDVIPAWGKLKAKSITNMTLMMKSRLHLKPLNVN
jgi:hypothetical protein